tara:strand:+ start:3197 stop:3670 length:474 start_codon:yes stop_codon:yes gene_type:complete
MAADFIRRRFSGPLHYTVKTGMKKRDPRLSGGFRITNEPVADVSNVFITGMEPKKGPLGTIQNRFTMGIRETNKPDKFYRSESFVDEDAIPDGVKASFRDTMNTHTISTSTGDMEPEGLGVFNEAGPNSPLAQLKIKTLRKKGDGAIIKGFTRGRQR